MKRGRVNPNALQFRSFITTLILLTGSRLAPCTDAEHRNLLQPVDADGDRGIEVDPSTGWRPLTVDCFKSFSFPPRVEKVAWGSPPREASETANSSLHPMPAAGVNIINAARLGQSALDLGEQTTTSPGSHCQPIVTPRNVADRRAPIEENTFVDIVSAEVGFRDIRNIQLSAPVSYAQLLTRDRVSAGNESRSKSRANDEPDRLLA
ncbi:hypothetical protein BDV10DRAFT_141462 [Aspergillus recurvatus]